MQSEVDVDIYFPVVNQDRKYKICTSVKTTFGKAKRTEFKIFFFIQTLVPVFVFKKLFAMDTKYLEKVFNINHNQVFSSFKRKAQRGRRIY